MAVPARLKVCVDSSVEVGPLVRRRFIIGAPSSPAACVADVAAALSARLALAGEPRLLLAVDGFALPAGERLAAILRDGDVLVVRGEGDGAPAAKRARREADCASGSLLALGDRLCRVESGLQNKPASVARVDASSPRSSRRGVPRSVPFCASSTVGFDQNGGGSDGMKESLSSAEAVRQAREALRAALPEAHQRVAADIAVVDGEVSLAAAKRSAMAALAASVGPVTTRTQTRGDSVVASTKSTTSTTSHADVPSKCSKVVPSYPPLGPASISHPILGDLEVPAGLDTETFVQRKLRRLGAAVRKQIEHYFSEKNLAIDEHLQSLADAEGYVKISDVADFERLKQLTDDVGFVTECLPGSGALEVSPCGDLVRRRA